MQALKRPSWHHYEAQPTGKSGWKAEEGAGSEIENNRIIVISCKQVRTTKSQTSKTELETTAGRGNNLKSQETSTVLSKHMAGLTAKAHHRKSKESDKRNVIVKTPKQAGQPAGRHREASILLGVCPALSL